MDKKTLRCELMKEGFLPYIRPDEEGYDEAPEERKYRYTTGEQFAVGESELTEQELQLAVQLETLRYVKKCYRIGCVLLIPVVTAILLGLVAVFV